MSDSSEMVMIEKPESNLPVMADPHMRLIEMAVSNGSDITQLEKLMDLQDRYEAKAAKKLFFDALSKFQSEVGSIKKGGKGNRDAEYSRLEDIVDAVKKPLGDNGLSFRFSQSQKDNALQVGCIVTHSAGHQEETVMRAPFDVSGNKSTIHAIASSSTYLRRYTLTAALGVVPGGEDDDGKQYRESFEQGSSPIEKKCADIERKVVQWCKAYAQNSMTHTIEGQFSGHRSEVYRECKEWNIDSSSYIERLTLAKNNAINNK